MTEAGETTAIRNTGNASRRVKEWKESGENEQEKRKAERKMGRTSSTIAEQEVSAQKRNRGTVIRRSSSQRPGADVPQLSPSDSDGERVRGEERRGVALGKLR
ncbi:hypothetical protein F2P79_021756 [Pimephales promelas]|nr:hypothetical protein F2P79_021756 [Pimephales promelas]